MPTASLEGNSPPTTGMPGAFDFSKQFYPVVNTKWPVLALG